MKEKKQKKKMSNRAFRAILIPILVLVTLICVVLNVAASVMQNVLDIYVATGKISIDTPEDKKDWDSDYYPTDYKDNNESRDAAYEVAKKVSEEGSVLLKNDGILPLAKGSSVMPFGNGYLNPIYGQQTSGGSAKWVKDPVTPEEGLSEFVINSTAADAMKQAGDPEALTEAAGTKSAGDAGSMLGGDCRIYEYDPAVYDGLTKAQDTTGMVFITRFGQEGQDQKFDAYSDGTPHYLALTENEKGAIRKAKEICGKVVVILVSSAPMELSELMGGDLEADAILWVGHPGERGFSTLSELLDGDVNPSGRTVDTWEADMTKDPSYLSLGEHTYSNYTFDKPGMAPGMGSTTMNALYNEYQEGVYMGYRYYETADLMDDSFVYGELDGKGAWKSEGAVCYPFGYGLSYTTFDQTFDDLTSDGYNVTATVTVTNTGDVAGKDVVQLYDSAPYTELDEENRIEKPAVTLVAFDKTDALEPGESQTLTLSFTTDDLTSYSYLHENPDGTKGCYILEEGDYTISLRNNSHDVIDTKTMTEDSTTWYDGSDEDHIRKSEIKAQSALDENGDATGTPKDPDATFLAATNLFQDSSDYMTEDSTILSRSDWAGTQPKEVVDGTKEISDDIKAKLGKEITFDPETDPELGNVEGSLVYEAKQPTSGADNGLVLSDLRGLDYNDPRWDLLLDEIDWEKDKDNIIRNFTGDSYLTEAIPSIGLPRTITEDGANGIKVPGVTDDASGYDMTKSSSFGFAPLMAATWNTDLLYEVGAAFGQESILNGVNGWYCPAINLHRSPFSGRVFEYYSEDPVLSGNLAAQVISGAGDQGMYCTVKHFALNDTETGRSDMIYTWADEQTFRELYLRSFEIAIKNAKMTIRYSNEDGSVATRVIRAATGVMPAQNCVGILMGHTNYALLTSLLRKEWGFQGFVISDYWVWAGDNLRDLAIRSGCDAYLCMSVPMFWNIEDYDSATARWAMRNAIHNLAYTVVNSNAMNHMAPGAVQKIGISPWKIWLAIADVVIAALVILGIVAMVRRAKDEKQHPDLYKRRQKKSKAKKA